MNHPVHSLFDDPSDQVAYEEHQESERAHDEALEVRDRAIERAGLHADGVFMDEAVLAVQAIARVQATLTSEDVVPVVTATTREPRAWGAVFREAQRRGWITPGPYVPSRDKTSHCRPKRLWHSRLYVERAA